ncbi:hypothetical protein HKI87_06g45220 [Chloropicon roscoffensis]|uniref:RRM domain-containing protein n=1 Tax=Chloropicon roscoffensis TaxID=1461544 RepID=A0AAX4P9A7_9CHLO
MEREVKAEAAGDDVKEEGEERKLGGHLETLGAKDLEERTHGLEVHGIPKKRKKEVVLADVRAFFKGYDLEWITVRHGVTYVYFYSVEDASSALERARGRDLRGIQVDVRVNRDPRRKLGGHDKPLGAEDAGSGGGEDMEENGEEMEPLGAEDLENMTHSLEVHGITSENARVEDVRNFFRGYDLECVIFCQKRKHACVYFYSVEDASSALESARGRDIQVEGEGEEEGEVGQLIQVDVQVNRKPGRKLMGDTLIIVGQPGGTMEDDVREFFTGRQIERVTMYKNTIHIDFASVEEGRRALSEAKGKNFKGSQVKIRVHHNLQRKRKRGAPAEGSGGGAAEGEAPKASKGRHNDDVGRVEVWRLPKTIDAREMKEMFRRAGTVTEAVVHIQDGSPKARATVTFADSSQAQRAVSTMHGKLIEGIGNIGVKMLTPD